jgi:hypothetical protein
LGQYQLKIPTPFKFLAVHFRNGFVPAVSLLKPPWRFQKRNRHLDPEAQKNPFGAMGVVIEICIKYPEGPPLTLMEATELQ